MRDVVRAMGPGEDMGVFKTKAMLRCFVSWLVALDADYHTANAKLNSLKPWERLGAPPPLLTSISTSSAVRTPTTMWVVEEPCVPCVP